MISCIPRTTTTPWSNRRTSAWLRAREEVEPPRRNAIAGRDTGTGANRPGAEGGAAPVGEDLGRGGETAAGPTSPTRLGGQTSSGDDNPGNATSS